MSDNDDKARHGLAPWHGTTILLVRKGNDVVLAGDGQVSVGNTIMKSNAKKLRRLSKGDGQRDVIAGFAGSTADALTLFERLEGKLEKHPGPARARLRRAGQGLAPGQVSAPARSHDGGRRQADRASSSPARATCWSRRTA